MKRFKLTYKPFGESAILIEWPKKILPKILNDIRLFVSKIEKEKIEAILELNYVYNTLLIEYDNDVQNYVFLCNQLKSIYQQEIFMINDNKSLFEIPVCYELYFGLDLEKFSAKKGLSINEIIELHCASEYMVYGIGFLPGFLYLGGLNKELFLPRKNTPILSVPKGSVAIGGNQTGIYPKTSPGGWHILGRTPISIFEVNNQIPCEIQPGDFIRFKSISKEKFFEIEELKKNNLYQLKHFRHA